MIALLCSRRASLGYPGAADEEDTRDKAMKHGFFKAFMVLAIPNIVSAIQYNIYTFISLSSHASRPGC